MLPFNGFSESSLQFLNGLKQNNSKSLFTDNRYLYDSFLLPEAQSFVIEIGKRFKQEIAPNIQAIP